MDNYEATRLCHASDEAVRDVAGAIALLQRLRNYPDEVVPLSALSAAGGEVQALLARASALTDQFHAACRR